MFLSIFRCSSRILIGPRCRMYQPICRQVIYQVSSLIPYSISRSRRRFITSWLAEFVDEKWPKLVAKNACAWFFARLVESFSLRISSRLAERVGKILKICGSIPTLFWVGLRGFVHLQGTPYDNSGNISLMCLKMARSRGPKSSKFVGELWIFSRMGQKPIRSASLASSCFLLSLFLWLFTLFRRTYVRTSAGVRCAYVECGTKTQ